MTLVALSTPWMRGRADSDLPCFREQVGDGRGNLHALPAHHYLLLRATPQLDASPEGLTSRQT